MAPWVSAWLMSPWTILTVLAVVIASTVILYVADKNRFRQFGFYRLAIGYLMAIAFMVPVSGFVGSFEWKESAAAFLFFAYIACLALAIVVVPAVFVLAARGRASAPWAIVASAVSAGLFAVAGYLLKGPGIGDAGEVRLLYDLLYAVILLTIVGIGFSLGAKLPWTR